MGNAVALGVAKCTVAHVVDKGLGCTAWLLNQAVASFDEAKTRDALASWHQKPHILYLEASGDGDPADIVVAASPRFDVYGNDFGRGTPVAVRSGAGNKMDGVVTVYPGLCEEVLVGYVNTQFGNPVDHQTVGSSCSDLGSKAQAQIHCGLPCSGSQPRLKQGIILSFQRPYFLRMKTVGNGLTI
jgi:hypothetical protein